MMRTLTTIVTMMLAVALSGCINTPNAKALVTPLGGVGVYSFAPPRVDPDRMPPPDADGVARIAANQQVCANDETCSKHE